MQGDIYKVPLIKYSLNDWHQPMVLHRLDYLLQTHFSWLNTQPLLSVGQCFCAHISTRLSIMSLCSNRIYNYHMFIFFLFETNGAKGTSPAVCRPHKADSWGGNVSVCSHASSISACELWKATLGLLTTVSDWVTLARGYLLCTDGWFLHRWHAYLNLSTCCPSCFATNAFNMLAANGTDRLRQAQL